MKKAVVEGRRETGSCRRSSKIRRTNGMEAVSKQGSDTVARRKQQTSLFTAARCTSSSSTNKANLYFFRRLAPSSRLLPAKQRASPRTIFPSAAAREFAGPAFFRNVFPQNMPSTSKTLQIISYGIWLPNQSHVGEFDRWS